MKVHPLTLAIVGFTAFALCAPLQLRAQGTTPSPPTPQKIVAAGGIKRLPPGVHVTPVPGSPGDIMMSEIGHPGKQPSPPPPPDGGAPIDSLPHRGRGFNPASLVLTLHLKPGQAVPSTTGFWISDASGHVVFQTALACAGCIAQHGVVNLGLDSKAAAAAAPFMVSGNTIHLVTKSHLAEANKIHATIGMRPE
jgi:hypothetical protein